VALTVLEVAFLVLFWTWALCAGLFLWNTVLPLSPILRTPDAVGLPSETIQFKATDGMRLEGWKIVADSSKPWIILCHGLGANRSDLLDVAAGLHRAGFNLFLFDFRGHGGSQGRMTSFGWTEQRDLEGALAFLGQQADVPARPYGTYAISMGGAVALMVAARDERLGAIAVESPYTDLGSSLKRHARLLYSWLPPVPFHGFLVSAYRVRFGIWPSRISPAAGAARLGRRPLLVITGGADIRMPPEEAAQLAQQASGPHELLVIQGAGHLEGFSIDPDGYTSRLVRFFEEKLP